MARRWTAAEDEQVRSHTLNQWGWKPLARRLGRSHAAVVNRAVRLRKHDPVHWCPKRRCDGAARMWMPDEDTLVMRLDQQGATLERIAAATGRTPNAVRQRLYRLRGSANPRQKVSKNERLRAATCARNGMTAAQIAARLGRSVSAIRYALRTDAWPKPASKRRPYTASDDATILAMLGAGETVAAVAKVLGRKHASVGKRARSLGALGVPVPSRPWTTAEVRRALTMHADGRSARQIARALGRTANAVQLKLARESAGRSARRS